jgi:hypothetical protein
MEQVGSFHAVAPIESVEPVVAYVPEVEDSQSFPAVRESEPAPEPVVDAPVMHASPVEDPMEPAPAMAAPSEPEPTPEPVAPAAVASLEVAPELVATELSTEPPAVAAISDATELTSSPEHAAVVHAVETALAVAAGTAVAGLAHVVHGPAPEPVRDVAPSADELGPHHEPFGDAALAEELAAALSTKAAGERVRSATLEAQAVPAAIHAEVSSGLSDSKLADAVARALESLKPQLITEIIKELAK